MARASSRTAGDEDNSESTEIRILNSAEEMFAKHGYHGVSMRSIVSHAGANSAATHYYFRSKENLFRAVVKRRAEQLNAERLQLLATCIDRVDGGRPDVSELLHALIGPAIKIAQAPGGRLFSILSGLATVEPTPEVQKIISEVYDETAREFVRGVRLARPGWSEEQVFWFTVCVYGAMTLVRTNNRWIQSVFEFKFDMSNADDSVKHLVSLLTSAAAD